jgi:hypothetical protein
LSWSPGRSWSAWYCRSCGRSFSWGSTRLEYGSLTQPILRRSLHRLFTVRSSVCCFRSVCIICWRSQWTIRLLAARIRSLPERLPEHRCSDRIRCGWPGWPIWSICRAQGTWPATMSCLLQ